MAANNEAASMELNFSFSVAYADSTGWKRREKKGTTLCLRGIPLILTQLRVKTLRPKDSIAIAYSVFSFDRLIGQEIFHGTGTDVSKKLAAQLSPDDLEIEGIILDETKSKPGKDFYEFFNLNWAPPDGKQGFTITLRELPARGGRQGQIQVLLDEFLVAQYWLDTNIEFIQDDVNDAIQLLTGTLEDLHNLNMQLDNEDQIGDGIH